MKLFLREHPSKLKKKKNIKIKSSLDIQNHVYRKIHLWLIGILIIGCIFLVLALLIDYTPKWRIKKYICIPCFNESVVSTIWGKICGGLKDLFNLAITVNTILAATVIFFYSVQDSCKEGIPHRVIMSYTFGSEAVPCCFIVTMILLPCIWSQMALSRYLSALVGIIFIYNLQLIILILILLATSHRYSIYAIVNCEIRQYQALKEMEEYQKSVPISEDMGNIKKSVQNDVKYVWTYLIHHIDQAVKSEEMTADKMKLIRKLLKVPFYTETTLKWRNIFDRKERKTFISSVGLKENKPEKLYEFYYGNLFPAFSYLKSEDNAEECNMVYMLLYEFLEELDCAYQKVIQEEGRKKPYIMNYLITVSGIMNAAMMSKSKNSEEDNTEQFCNYIFNNCLSDEILVRSQLVLYFLFQEYLYRTNKAALSLKELEEIQFLRKWTWEEQDRELCNTFWGIWMKWETLSNVNSATYLWEAIRTLNGTRHDSVTIYYIMQKIIQMRRKYPYESKSDTVDQ